MVFVSELPCVSVVYTYVTLHTTIYYSYKSWNTAVKFNKIVWAKKKWKKSNKMMKMVNFNNIFSIFHRQHMKFNEWKIIAVILSEKLSKIIRMCIFPLSFVMCFIVSIWSHFQSDCTIHFCWLSVKFVSKVIYNVFAIIQSICNYSKSVQNKIARIFGWITKPNLK